MVRLLVKSPKPLSILSGVSGWFWLYVGLILLGAYLLYAAIVPTYKSPNSRLWSSAMGYPAMLRKMNAEIPVETALPSQREMVRTVSAAGEIGFLHEVPINIEVASIVTDVYVESGAKIKVGDLLLRLDNGGSPTRLARLDVEDKRNAYEKARRDYLREKEAFKSGIIAQTDLAQYEADMNQARIELNKAQESLSQSFESRSKNIFGDAKQSSRGAKTDILSPIDGEVVQVATYAGENILGPKNGLMSLGDTLMFKASVDQRYFSTIQAGNRAEVYLQAYPDKPFAAKVIKIDNFIAVAGKAEATVPYTFNVWLELEGVPTESIPLARGMNGYCRFDYPFQALAIPEKALLNYSGQRGVVMTVNAERRLELKQVTYSASMDGMVAISSGLGERERVVLSGQVGLQSGDKVKFEE